MISRTPSPGPSPSTSAPHHPLARPVESPQVAPLWRRELAEAVRSVETLLELLDLDPETVGLDLSTQHEFPLRVPRGFVARMNPGDPRDPLLLQVLPRPQEAIDTPGWTDDPLEEASSSPVPGLLHKYAGRALVVLTGACAVHCRYCFRRHFPYGDHVLGDAAWQKIVDYLARDASIEEVLLSGGDPLSVSDEILARRARDLAAIPHLRRLRIHSRQPIVLPSRVDDALLEWLTTSRLQPVMVLHTNHAREIDTSVRQALERLREARIPLFNQAVLLKGVNDRTDSLCDLSQTLFASGVLPYYLHLMDRVRGASHFEVDPSTARRLVEDVMGRLPGYLVPRLVREVPGALSKSPVFG